MVFVLMKRPCRVLIQGTYPSDGTGMIITDALHYLIQEPLEIPKSEKTVVVVNGPRGCRDHR
jgi:hypothetical protein